VSDALTPPFLIAALVLCLAGLAKLRAPAGAAHALASLGLPGYVRPLAAGEVALGGACALDPTAVLAAGLALLYGLFGAVAAILMRRRLACGCFGENDLPVSPAHVIASELLALVAGAAALTSPHGLGWLAGQPVTTAVVFAVGIAGALYGVVLVYTEMPRAWAAWSGR
jgi:hypothetical protein